MEADRDRFDKARTAWDRIPEIELAKSDGYLEAATVFWDYYRYDDALRWIEEGRKRLKQDSLFAFEAGAIHENQRNYPLAIREYAKGAIAQPASNSEQRLLLLARPALHCVRRSNSSHPISSRTAIRSLACSNFAWRF